MVLFFNSIMRNLIRYLLYNCKDNCTGEDSGNLSEAAARAWVAGHEDCRTCTPPLPTGGGGKVTVGWGEYFHSVVDYKRDPTQGGGCNSCLFGGTANDTSLPSLEVVRFFGSRDCVFQRGSNDDSSLNGTTNFRKNYKTFQFSLTN